MLPNFFLNTAEFVFWLFNTCAFPGTTVTQVSKKEFAIFPSC